MKISNIYKIGVVFYTGTAWSTIKHNTLTAMKFEDLISFTGASDTATTRFAFALFSGLIWPVLMVTKIYPPAYTKFMNFIDDLDGRPRP